MMTAVVAAAMVITALPGRIYASEPEAPHADTLYSEEDIVTNETGEDGAEAEAIADESFDRDGFVIIDEGADVSAEVVQDETLPDDLISDETLSENTVSGDSLLEDAVTENDITYEDALSDNEISDENELQADGAPEKIKIEVEGELIYLRDYNVSENKVSGSFTQEVEKGSTVTFRAFANQEGYNEAYEVGSVKIGDRNVTFKPNYIKDAEGKVIDTVHYYEIANIDRYTKLTVTRQPKQIPNGLGFKVINDAVHAQFIPGSRLTGSNGTYKFKKDATEFGFTIKSEGAYVPKIYIGHMEGGTFVEEPKWTYMPPLRKPGEAVNSSGTGVDRSYTHVPAYVAADKVIRITEEEKPENKYFIVNTNNIESLTARVNGRYTEVKFHGDSTSTYELWFPLFSSVTVHVTPKSHCKMKGVYVNYSPFKLSSSNEFSFRVAGNGSLNLQAEGIPTMYIDDRAYSSGCTVKKMYNGDPFDVSVYEGGMVSGNELVISTVTAKIGKKNAAAGFAVLSADKKTLTIDPKKGEGRKVTLTLKGKNKSGAAYTRTMAVAVSARSTKVSVKGFKNHSVSRRPGTSAGYRVTLSGKNTDYSMLNMEARYADGGAGVPNVSYDKTGRKLWINTFMDEAGKRVLETRSIAINFYYGDVSEENKLGSPFTVNIPETGIKPAKPSVTMGWISDIDAVVSVKPAKKDKGVSNLYYRIRAVADGSPAAGMKGEVTEYLKVSGASGSVRLHLADSDEKGKGVKQKYRLYVNVIQLKESTGNIAEDIADSNILIAGPDRIKNITTKNPAYETSIKIKNIKKAFFRGQEIALARVGFSKNTTFDDFSAFIDGVKLEDKYISGNRIVLDGAYTDTLTPGRHTLTVKPVGKDENTRSRSVGFTVRQKIERLNVNASTAKLYKKVNKKASFRATVTYNYGTPAPAVKKVRWLIGDKNGDPLASGDARARYIRVKNGVVTVNKKYILSATDENNYITVIATANDYKGNTVRGVSAPVLISNVKE